MRIKLRSFDSNVFPDEKIQDVFYRYSIEDSSGVLEINLTMSEENDPVEQFILKIKDLYKGFNTYNIYCFNYKYTLLVDNNSYQLNKVKMY